MTFCNIPVWTEILHLHVGIHTIDSLNILQILSLQELTEVNIQWTLLQHNSPVTEMLKQLNQRHALLRQI